MHPKRNFSAWTFVLAGVAAGAIVLGAIGSAQAVDRPNDPRNRAARSTAAAAKNAAKPKTSVRANPAVANPGRTAIRPNPTVNGGPVKPAANTLHTPAANTPHNPAATNNQPSNNQQQRAATDPRGRLNAANDPRNRLNVNNDPRSRLNAVNDPRSRLNANDPRNRLNAANDPRNRLNGALDQRSRMREALEHRRLLLDHRQVNFLARARLPVRPYFGERGFSAVPPVGETRFVTNEMVFHVGPNVSRATVDEIMRRHGMTVASAESTELMGGTMFHVRVAAGKPMGDVVRAMEAEKVGLAQPNYVYYATRDEAVEAVQAEAGAQLEAPPAQPDAPAPAAGEPPQDTTLAARPAGGDPSQYVVNKLKLGEVHRLATGSNVLVAVIDSQIDVKHPDLAKSIVEQYDAVGRADKPDTHGTGMAGAIAAQRKLLGVAPGAKILAIHAFSPDASDSPQATTAHILAGIEYAIKKGARVINMSFAGPYDPVLQLAMKKAREKGVVLIAAAGNAGPKSPPLYPAADPNVIAVTATDANDRIFAKANRGPQVAIAAPGVEILEPAPNAGYQLTTGTSVAAAHVSGVAALLIGRNPSADPTAVADILTMSAKHLAPSGRDDDFGWGLVDPVRALAEMDAKVARDRDLAPARPATAQPLPTQPLTPRSPPTAAVRPAASGSASAR